MPHAPGPEPAPGSRDHEHDQESHGEDVPEHRPGMHRAHGGTSVRRLGFSHDTDAALVERAAIAAYNCGEGNVRKAIEAGIDVDAPTAGHDYSRAVLAFAEAYRGLAAFEPPPPQPMSTPAAPQAASAGLWGAILGWLMKIFVRRSSP